MTKDEKRLIQVEEFVARQVNSVHGYLTAGEANELQRLRDKLGKSWDAINGYWVAADYDEDEENGWVGARIA